MRSATGAGILPKALGASKLSARVWLALAAALGAGVCGYAGLYPRFDEGNLRIVLALTSAPFAAAVVVTAASARTAARAFGLALVFSALLGIASIVLPAAIMSHSDRHADFVISCFFGAFFAAPTGVLYGIPLGILAAIGQPHVQAGTHESTDRAARVAGGWLFFVALIALAGTRGLDEGKMDWATQTVIPLSPLPALFAGAAALTGIAFVVRAFARLARRAAWIRRVRWGLEPTFRLRAVDLRDRLVGLPRLGHAAPVTDDAAQDRATVLEWLPAEGVDATSGTAYRAPAAGRAVAIVSDAAPLAL